MNYAQIVGLYLPCGIREEFYDKAKDYIDRYSTVDLGDQRLKKVNEDMERIQEIFEQELSAYFWIHTVQNNLSKLVLNKYRSTDGHKT